MHELSARLEELAEGVLARPIVIVVPSFSLRTHLLCRLSDRSPSGLAGVSCRTLHGLARECVERSGGRLPGDVDLFPVFARRAAQKEPSLRRSLDHLRDGYGAVLGPVRDLLDAGLDPAHAEALDEVLAEEGRSVASRVEIERAQALVRVAAATWQALAESGGGRASTLLQRAAELVRRRAASMPEFGALLVHGFTDATGVATDFLETLLETYRGTLFLDQPLDLIEPSRFDPGVAFSRRFSERLQVVARLEPAPEGEIPASRLELLRAFGGEAEVRTAARRIRELLDAETPPERIAVVARQIAPYRSIVRKHFTRLGIPFSGAGADGPQGSGGRRLNALFDLLDQRGRTPVDRWLDASGPQLAGAPLHDLRVALFSLGAGRLEEAAGLELDGFLKDNHYSLPARLGFRAVGPDTDSDSESRLSRRRVSGVALREMVDRAARICHRLDVWHSPQSVGAHLSTLEHLLLDDLVWPPESDFTEQTLREIAALASELSEGLPLNYEEFRRLIRTQLRELGRADLGGQGAGVQILEVTEARSRTFDHLFLLGLNRGAFPRTIREDPLLPDGLRRVIGREGHGVLPDLSRKLAGFDEERFLFAQLINSSPHVTLSWQVCDDDNTALSPSPLVERLRWSTAHGEEVESALVSNPHALVDSFLADSQDGWMGTAIEASVLTAIHGGRRQLADVLPIALLEPEELSRLVSGDAAESEESTDAGKLARARIRVLDEIDPERGTRRGETVWARLGPYYGFVGETRQTDPRRNQSLYITTLERLAACPWNTFLDKVLRIEPLPDPLEILPEVDPLMVGGLVHRVLERIVRERPPGPAADLAQARAVKPARMSWPRERELRSMVRREARKEVRDRGFGVTGLSDILAEIVVPHLEAAREADWDTLDDVSAVAAEWEGELQVQDADGTLQRLHFRADRLDRLAEGLRLTDYKTGRGLISTSAKAETRHRHLRRAIASGEWMQAAAYALAAGDAQDSGRYLFLNPILEDSPERRSVVVRADDSELVAAFQQSASVLIRAWRGGHFFPRLVEPDRDLEPRRCGYCTLAEACLRYDSSSRARLREWAHRVAESVLHEPTLLSQTDRDVASTWLLPSRRSTKQGVANEVTD